MSEESLVDAIWRKFSAMESWCDTLSRRISTLESATLDDLEQAFEARAERDTDTVSKSDKEMMGEEPCPECHQPMETQEVDTFYKPLPRHPNVIHYSHHTGGSDCRCIVEFQNRQEALMLVNNQLRSELDRLRLSHYNLILESWSTLAGITSHLRKWLDAHAASCAKEESE